ncbi:hypothetical protein [Limnohabitans sp.]|uniref:hypothetical protein n=1 Tax=Limnohabitans sp. TaxID=1907725 RepID=UPI0037BE3DE8
MRRQAVSGRSFGTRPWRAVGLGLFGLGLCWQGLAQEVIYRCGQEYTNAPRDITRCERLPEQAVTVIPGLRPQAARQAAGSDTPVLAPALDAERIKSEPAQAAAVQQSERDVLARTILAEELARMQKQHQALLQVFNQGEPTQSLAETAAPHKYQERVTELKAAIHRTERDIDSVQRELARRPLATKALKP